jgi:hypothetical protein
MKESSNEIEVPSSMQLVITLFLVEIFHLAFVFFTKIMQLSCCFVIGHPLFTKLTVVLCLTYPVFCHYYVAI